MTKLPISGVQAVLEGARVRGGAHLVHIVLVHVIVERLLDGPVAKAPVDNRLRIAVNIAHEHRVVAELVRTFVHLLKHICINIQLTSPNSPNTQSTPTISIPDDNTILSQFNDVTSNWINFILYGIVSLSLSLRTISASFVNLFIISSITSWHQQCHLGL